MTPAKAKGFKVTLRGAAAIVAMVGVMLGVAAKFNAVEFQTTELNEHVDVIEVKLDVVQSEVDRHDEQLKAQVDTSKKIEAGIDKILVEQRAIGKDVAALKAAIQ